MEFCSDNLKNIINTKHQVFKRDKTKEINDWEYQISYKIFIELLEALCIFTQTKSTDNTQRYKTSEYSVHRKWKTNWNILQIV